MRRTLAMEVRVMRMQGTKQLERAVTIHAPVPVVYGLFMDNRELPNWAPVVNAVLREEGGDESGLGCTRTCAVTMGRKSGTMVERCVEAIRDSRASFVVVEDSFGFNRMLTDYGFTVDFAPSGDDQTSVRIVTYYTPTTRLAALLNRLIMKHKFRGVVDSLLVGLGTLAERRHRTVT